MSTTNKPTVIAVNILHCQNVTMLQDSGEFIFHNNPRFWVTSEGTIANFDFYLDVEIEEMTKKISLGEKYIPMKRLAKSIQMSLIYEAGLHHPPSILPFDGVDREQLNAITRLDLKPNDSVVLKTEHGARGTGQITLQAKDFGRFLKGRGDLDKLFEQRGTFYEVGGAGEDDEEDKLMCLLRQQYPYLIQKRLKLKEEFRLLFNCMNEIIIMRRIAEDKGGWQSTGFDGEVISNDEFPELYENLNKIQKLIALTGYAFGSMDLYITEEGDVGVLEFSPEFGIYGPWDLQEIRRLTLEGLRHRVSVARGEGGMGPFTPKPSKPHALEDSPE